MKNLVLLEQDYKEEEKDILKLSDEILECETKLGVGSSGFSEIISSPTRKNTTDIILSKYISAKIKHDVKIKKMERLKNQINFYYELYKQSNNEDEMIYIEKKIKKYSNAKVSVLHGGIDTSTINRKVKKVEEKYGGLIQKDTEEKQLIESAIETTLKELRANI